MNVGSICRWKVAAQDKIPIFSYLELICAALKPPFWVSPEEISKTIDGLTRVAQTPTGDATVVLYQLGRQDNVWMKRGLYGERPYPSYFYTEFGPWGPQHPSRDAHEVIAHDLAYSFA